MVGELRISHAQIQPVGLGEYGSTEFFRHALNQSWVPGIQVTRYTRTWKLSRRIETDKDLWAGYLGFINEGELSTLNWDEEIKDFIRGEASSGIVVPFLISDTHRIVSFQLFPGKVRPKTVTSNLQALLNAEGTHTWKVSPVSLLKSFEQWRATVDRVSMINTHLTYPNPDWEDRDTLKQIMDGFRGQKTRITARADEQESIDTDSDLFRQVMDHVLRGYGSLTATGHEIETGDKSQFVQTPDSSFVPIMDQITCQGDTSEVELEDLYEHQNKFIENHSSEIVTVDLEEELDDDTSD